MPWTYRVMRQTCPSGEPYFGIHEVYYDGDQPPHSWSSAPRPVGGDSIDDLRWTLEKMLLALDQPVLDIPKDEP